MNKPLIQVRDLKKHFPVRRGIFSRVQAHVKAVDGVSFQINEGETLGLVGESGCGKTTTGRTLLRLQEPTSGEIRFDGKDVAHARGAGLRSLRRNMQIVFQDPYGSLNPRMTVRSIVEEGLIIHGVGSRAERLKRVCEILEKVGLEAGLDVSIQSQIINLLTELKAQYRLTYLFISHDLSVVEYISDRVAVMYLGQIVESARSEDLYRDPLHPYTKALLSSIPTLVPKKKSERIVLPGDVPSPIDPPPGCRFHPRCPLAMEICKTQVPRELNYGGHVVHCHAVEQERGAPDGQQGE
jgi:oligopeptide/dipeptide ABC transporter ATP-binding protein